MDEFSNNTVRQMAPKMTFWKNWMVFPVIQSGSWDKFEISDLFGWVFQLSSLTHDLENCNFGKFLDKFYRTRQQGLTGNWPEVGRKLTLKFSRLARLHSLLESELLLCFKCLHWTSFHCRFKYCCYWYAQAIGTFYQPYAESLSPRDRYSIWLFNSWNIYECYWMCYWCYWVWFSLANWISL